MLLLFHNLYHVSSPISKSILIRICQNSVTSQNIKLISFNVPSRNINNLRPQTSITSLKKKNFQRKKTYSIKSRRKFNANNISVNIICTCANKTRQTELVAILISPDQWARELGATSTKREQGLKRGVYEQKFRGT